MSALEDIFSERIELSNGGHADVLINQPDEGSQIDPKFGQKTLGWNTHAPPPRGTMSKPDSRGHNRCWVEGEETTCDAYKKRGLSGIASLKKKIKSLRKKYGK